MTTENFCDEVLASRIVNKRAVLCTVIIAAAACHADGGGTTPSYTITSPGDGDTNVQPLLPIGIGYEGRAPDTAQTVIVDGTIAHDGTGALYRAVGIEDGWVQWFLVRDDGVFAAGNTKTGLLSRPVLIAPATVRNGMEWTVPGALKFTVAHATDPNGMLVPKAWAITATALSGSASTTLIYVEGLGIRTAANDPSGPLVVPRAPANPVTNMLPRSPIAMTAVAMPDPDNDGGFPMTSLSMIRRPDGGALFTTGAGIGQLGSQPASYCYKSMDGATLARGQAVAGNAISSRTDLACLQAGVTDTDENGTQLTQSLATGQATSAFVGTDGTIYYFARKPGGRLAMQDHVQVQLSQGWVPLYFQPGPTPGGPPTVTLDCINCAVDRDHLTHASFDQLASGQNFTPVYDPVPWDRVWAADANAIRDDEGGTSVVIYANDGALWGSTLDGPPHAFGRLPGVVSAQTNVGGTELVRLSGDGGVDRIHASHGTLWLEHLGEAQLPAGDIPEAAFVWHDPSGDRLLVFSSVYDDSFLGSHIHAWRSTDVLPVGTRIAQPASLAIGEQPASDTDEIVCGLDGAGDASPTGWTVNGAPALAFGMPGTPCAMVLGSGRVEGPLPGVGNTLVSLLSTHARGFFGYRWLPEDVWNAMQGMVAPLPGDAFVSRTARIGPGASTVTLAPIMGVTGAVIDRGGHGLWVNTSAGIVLRGATSDAPIANSAGLSLDGPVVGGGVVASGAGMSYAIQPDGTRVAFATSGAGPVVFPDGTSCDATIANATCVSAAGVVRTASYPRAPSGSVFVAIYPLRDGTLFLHFVAQTLGGTTMRALLDPVTMTITDLGDESLIDAFPAGVAVTYAADGTPYFGTASLDRDGLHPHAAVASGDTGGGTTFVVGEHLFIFVAQGFGTPVQRIARTIP